MNQTPQMPQTPQKLEYAPPRLEQHPSFSSVTGASLPFGTLRVPEPQGGNNE
jgi:hypothetical protein